MFNTYELDKNERLLLRRIQMQLKLIRSIKKKRCKMSYLVVVAHPDDEIMFLSPTIKKLKSYGVPMKIICMSTGNYDGLGKLRIEEFNNVAQTLGMKDYKIIDHPQMQDHLYKPWNISVVESYLKDYLDNNPDIGTIISFDEKGVTKHPNHMSVHKGIQLYIKEHKYDIMKKGINIFFFDTFSPFIQYGTILPYLNMYFKESGFFDWNFFFSWNHMKLYKTQFNFPRRVHVLCSGYTFSNSFNKVQIMNE